MVCAFDLIIICTLIRVLYGSELYFLKSSLISLPDPSTVHLENKHLAQINSYLLGMTSKAPVTWKSESAYSKLPRAMIIMTVSHGNLLRNLLDAGYQSIDDHTNLNFDSLISNEKFKNQQEWLVSNSGKVRGSQIANEVNDKKSPIDVKVRLEPLRQEITSLYKISEAVSDSKLFDSSDTPSVFLIDIDGLSGIEGTSADQDYQNALHELEKAIQHLVASINNVFDDRAIIELISVSNMKTIKRSKRETSSEERIGNLRKSLGVYKFVSPDFPAIFAIIAGVSIFLAVAVIFISVGLLTMDPGKDSIIYRMTTTRMKKD